MASDAQRGDEDDTMDLCVRHSCCLCLETYEKRCPKMLPCFHTFCLPCLTALEASLFTTASQDQTSGDAGERGDGLEEETCEKEGVKGKGGENGPGIGEKPEFLCPTCRAPVPLAPAGVAGLQTNFYIEGWGSTRDEPPTPALCGMCDDQNQQPAAYDCPQCQMPMCRSCRRYHDKLMPKHQPTSLPTCIQEKREGLRQRSCVVHVDQPLCFHCRQCQVSVCLHCKVTSHEGHDTVDLATAALHAKKEIAVLIPSAQQQVQILESSYQRVERDDGQLRRHTQDVKQRIEARYGALLSWTRQARDQLVEEASAKDASSRSQLTAEKSSIAFVRDSLSSLLSRAALASSVDVDVVTLKNELKEAMLSKEKLDVHRKRAQEGNRPWGWGYDVVDASVLQAEDVRAYMGQVSEGAEVDAARSPLSLSELAGRVDTWMNSVQETVTKMTSQLASHEDEVAALQKKEADLETRMKAADDEIAASRKAEGVLQKKTAALNTDVQKLSSLKDAVTALQETARSHEDKLAQAKRMEDDLQKKAEKVSSDVQKQLSSLKDNLTAQKRSSDALRITTLALESKIEKSGKMVSFIASGIDTEKTDSCHRIVFSDVEVNNGNCYDKTTGFFTVTVPGCYTFSCSIGSSKREKYVCAYFVVDVTQYSKCIGSYSLVGCSSMSVQLKKGQKVWVRDQSTEVEDYFGGELWFTGALVQPEL